MGKRGKKYDEARGQVDRSKAYPVAEGLALAKSLGFAKFDESIDVAFRLGVNPKYSDQMVRGS